MILLCYYFWFAYSSRQESCFPEAIMQLIFESIAATKNCNNIRTEATTRLGRARKFPKIRKLEETSISFVLLTSSNGYSIKIESAPNAQDHEGLLFGAPWSIK